MIIYINVYLLSVMETEIFGGVERISEKRLFAVAVEDRSTDTIRYIIEINYANTIEGTWNGIKCTMTTAQKGKAKCPILSEFH